MNHRNVNHNANDIFDYRVAPHASIDSHIIPDQNSVDIFCDVSQEEWKENSEKKKIDKGQKSKMFKWFEEKWIYIKAHRNAALIIGGIILLLIGLFITAVLLLTLLPKKNDSVESNNITPGPQPTQAPESSHGFGRVNKFYLF
uniref:Uncharacterized protein n=1 Tax=Panagrolaimus sp. PS1159 TaxID=55785 RepID=A0AC35FCG1_9BILA